MHHPGSASDNGSQRGFGLINLIDREEPAVVPFHLQHLQLMMWRDYDRDYTIMLPLFEERMTAIYEAGGPMATLVHGGRIIACMGMTPTSEHSGYLWLFGSIYLHEHLGTYIKILLKLLGTLQTDHGMRRLQSVCVADDEAALKWVAALGFEQEGKMRQYDVHGKDYIMCSIVKAASPPAPVTQ